MASIPATMTQSTPSPSSTRAPEPKEFYTSFGAYSAFMSVVFGVFVSVWIQPLSDLISGPAPSPPVSALATALYTGAPMFGVLVCLWWWYAVFLGRCHPSNSFFMYGYDFSSLVVFALGFRFWHYDTLLDFIVPLGSVFVGIRIFFAKQYGALSKHDSSAAWIAIVTTLFILLASLLVFVDDILQGNLDWSSKLHVYRPILLIIGVIATVAAALIIEGMPQSLRSLLRWSIRSVRYVWRHTEEMARSEDGYPSLPPGRAETPIGDKAPSTKQKAPRRRTGQDAPAPE